MDKYYWIQIQENCNVGLAGQHLDIRLHVPEGLTKEQAKALDDEITNAMCEYGEEHDGDYSAMDYHIVLNKAAEKLNIKFEYPKVDYTIYV